MMPTRRSADSRAALERLRSDTAHRRTIRLREKETEEDGMQPVKFSYKISVYMLKNISSRFRTAVYAMNVFIT